MLKNDVFNFIHGYCPIEVDFYRKLIICKTFLGVGMKGTPEEKIIKEAGLGHKLKDIDFDKIWKDKHLAELLLEDLQVAKALHYSILGKKINQG